MFLEKKAVGLELCAGMANMCLLSGAKDKLRLDAWASVPISQEMVRFSSREPNVLNPALFVEQIKKAHLPLLAKTRRVALSLPDSCGRIFLMDLDERFKNHEEGLNIIRWKLKKTLPFDSTDTTLDYQVLCERDTGEISLLVSLMALPVVTQYEELLVEAGLEPQLVDFTSFNLYSAYSSRIELAENAACVLFHSGVITLLIFYDGLLEFYRSKEMASGPLDAARIYREISSSLVLYREKFAGRVISDLYYAAPSDVAADFGVVVAEAFGDARCVAVTLDSTVTDRGGASVGSELLGRLAASIGAARRNL